MLLKEATPELRPPPDATLAVIDYRDMGIDFIADMIHWSQREKILTQSPIVPAKWAGSWLRVIGRSDVRVADWDARPPDAFLLLMTRKERAFFLEQGLPHTVGPGWSAAGRPRLVRLGEPTGPFPRSPVSVLPRTGSRLRPRFSPGRGQPRRRQAKNRRTSALTSAACAVVRS